MVPKNWEEQISEFHQIVENLDGLFSSIAKVTSGVEDVESRIEAGLFQHGCQFLVSAVDVADYQIPSHMITVLKPESELRRMPSASSAISRRPRS